MIEYKKDDTGAYIIPLSKPLTTPDGDVKELHMRQPLMGDLCGLKIGAQESPDDQALLYSRLCKIPVGCVKKIPLCDLANLSEVFVFFSQPFRPIGGTA
jgi:hypothetical protein